MKSGDGDLSFDIRAATSTDAEATHAALDAVARERRWLGRAKAGSLEGFARFIEYLEASETPMRIALSKGKVIGFCDISRPTTESRSHVGVLGMGVLSDHRGFGVGRALLEAVLADAVKAGIERVELDVLADNTAALKLYEAFGFVREGVRPGAWKLDDQSRDIVLMGLLCDERSAGAK